MARHLLRHLSALAALMLLAAMFVPTAGHASGKGNRPSPADDFVHGMALGDAPRYGPDFTHFRYTDPAAVRGGELRLSAMGTFDKLNPFTLKGIAARGVIDLMFESLTTGSLDEPMSMYGLLAKQMKLAPDRLSITFRLRPEARFSNGDPVTADDVKFSFDTLRSKAASPMQVAKLVFVALSHAPAQVRFVDTVLAYYVGNKMQVECDIGLAPDMHLKNAHDIGENLQRRLEAVDDVERAFVHLDTEFEHSKDFEHVNPWKKM